MKCIKGYEVEPQRSTAGYFMGTVDEEQMLNCRLTTQYAKTREGALKLPIDRECATENVFCNGGCGQCFPNKAYKLSSNNATKSGSNLLFDAANAADVK